MRGGQLGGTGSDMQRAHRSRWPLPALPHCPCEVCTKVMKCLLLQKEKLKVRQEVLTTKVLAKPWRLELLHECRVHSQDRHRRTVGRTAPTALSAHEHRPEATGAQKPPKNNQNGLEKMCQELGSDIPFPSGTGWPGRLGALGFPGRLKN